MLSQNQVSRRRMLELMGLAAAGTTLAACQPMATPGTKGGAAPTAIAKEATPAPPEDIVITLHMRAGGDQSEPPIYVGRPALFMEENPGIKIELAPIPGSEFNAKISTMAAAKTIGDCMWSTAQESTKRFAELGVLGPLDDFMAAEGVSRDEWVPGARDAVTYKGKFYGIPKNANAHCYVYTNEDLVAEAGFEVPEDIHDLTVDGMLEWAVKTSKGPEDDREVFGLSPSLSNYYYTFNLVCRPFGTTGYNQEGTEILADNDEWYEGMQWAVDFHKQRTVPSADALPSGGNTALFAAGRLAMLYGGRWQWKNLDAAVKASENPFQWKAIFLPNDRPNALPFNVTSDTHSLVSTSEHPAETFKFLYALGDKKFTELVAKGIGYLTARVDDLETIKPFITPWLETQYEASRATTYLPIPANFRTTEASSVVVNGLQPLWLLKEELTRDYMKMFKADVDSILAKPAAV